jgi:negative regulator of flagellin synthesis FlgM
MIDPVGTKASAVSDLRTDAVKLEAKVSKVAEAAVATKLAANTVSVSAREAVKTMAATPPVDVERVAQIKKAVAEGRFPIYPATIADRLIAFEQGYRYQ